MGSGIRILLLYFCRGKTSSYQHNDEGNKEENVYGIECCRQKGMKYRFMIFARHDFFV